MKNYDYGIIGGGPGGYTCAMMLAKQGKSVILFEKDKLGGTCLNKGCIPTKAILHISELYRELQQTSDIGIISCNNIKPNLYKIQEQKNQIVEKIRKSLELAVKNSGTEIVYKEAFIKNADTIISENEIYNCKKIILATGSKPKTIKNLMPDQKFIFDSDGILNITELPKSIVIAGSGAIGIEWARILSNFGCEVTVIEMAQHLIPNADIEISKRIERIFKQRKIKFYLNTSITGAENNIVFLSNGEELKTDMLLVAAGRVPCKQNCDCIDIIGDACGEIQLAHFAIHQAKNLALGIDFNKKLIPSVIYGEPEIAWVGLREQDIDDTYSKTILPITALGKSWCDNCTDGFIKIITKDGNIYGAHIVSKEASSLIHIFVIAIQNNISIKNLQKVCFAHPTYAEGIFDLVMKY